MDDVLVLATPDDVARRLGERLRAARRRRGWTQAEMARRSGVSVATVARIEQSGQGQIASLLHLIAALDRLHDLDDVLVAGAPASLEELRRLRGGS